MCAGVGSGDRFRKVPVCAGVGSGGRFRIRRVPVCAGVGSGCNFRKVSEGSGECGLLSCSLDRSSLVIVFEHLLVMTLSAWKTAAEHECAHVVKHGIRLLRLGIPPKLISKFVLQLNFVTQDSMPY